MQPQSSASAAMTNLKSALFKLFSSAAKYHEPQDSYELAC